jgi:hypothetical protein
MFSVTTVGKRPRFSGRDSLNVDGTSNVRCCTRICFFNSLYGGSATRQIETMMDVGLRGMMNGARE